MSFRVDGNHISTTKRVTVPVPGPHWSVRPCLLSWRPVETGVYTAARAAKDLHMKYIAKGTATRLKACMTTLECFWKSMRTVPVRCFRGALEGGAQCDLPLGNWEPLWPMVGGS